METVQVKKDRKKASDKKLMLMNCESYLFTIPEAALLCRVNRDKFLDDFLGKGFQIVLIGSDKFIRHAELQRYQEMHVKILRAS